MRTSYAIAGGLLFSFGVVGFIVGLLRATASDYPYNVQMSGRTLAPLGAVPTGAGIALLILGFMLEDPRRTGRGESLSVYGGAATLAGGVLAIVGFLWASMTACQGYVINYGHAGEILYQRCSGSMTPFPFAAIIVALIGGVLLPLVLLPAD